MHGIVLSARRYDFADPNGKQVRGVSVAYIEQHPELEPDRRGHVITNISGPLEVWEQLTEVPALYDLDFKLRPGKMGKPSVQLVGCQLVQRVDVMVREAPGPSS